jgi:cytochrome c-type biogenesis protein CcmH
MIWLALAALAIVAMAPLAFSLLRHSSLKKRKGAALALYQAQLAELEQEREQGQLTAAEYEAAQLEVKRRLLAAAEAAEPPVAAKGRGLVLAAFAVVPAVAMALYLVGGTPWLPAMPLAEQQAKAREEEALLQALRARLATMDPHSPRAREGFVLLGNAESARGHYAAAADAYQHALMAGFDPTLAAMAAEALARAEGRVTPQAASLFRQALAQAPADAPWRKLAEERLHEAATP